jgi:TolB-like protein
MTAVLATALRGTVAVWCIWTLVVLPIRLPLAFAQAASPPRPRIAVLEFESLGVTPAEAAAVTDQLRSDLVRIKAFTVLDRAQTQAVLNEMALQQTGVTDPNQAVRIGKLLNVEYIVTGRITALTGAYQVNAQMIRVENGVIERSESIVYQGHMLGLLSENMATMAARLSATEDASTSSAPAADKPKAVNGKDEGIAWWVWALVGVGVIGLAVALSGGDEAAPAAAGPGPGPAAPTCPSPSGCGSMNITW